MDSIGKRQCADLAWPTTEELFREPPTQECDICSLPMSNAVKPWLEGSLAMFSVSRFMLSESCARCLLFGCSRNVFISLAAGCDLPRLSLCEFDGAREPSLSILSQ